MFEHQLTKSQHWHKRRKASTREIQLNLLSISPIQNYVRHFDKLKKHLECIPWLPNVCMFSDPMNILLPRYQSWSKGSAITMPKMETSKNIIQVGNDCFLAFLPSFTASILCTSSPKELGTLSNIGVEFSSRDISADTCSATSFSASCCWLYFSTYSGNNFLKVGLLWWRKSDPVRIWIETTIKRCWQQLRSKKLMQGDNCNNQSYQKKRGNSVWKHVKGKEI